LLARRKRFGASTLTGNVGRLLGFLILGLFAVCWTPATAASPWRNVANPVFEHIDTRGLPEAAAMSLAQDSAGFLWIGMQGGLARFDGYTFRNFLADPSDPNALPDGYVRSLAPDADGDMWIGSSSNGLVHFDAATETFHTYGTRSGAVDALLQARGVLWVGGDGGLQSFDARRATFTAIALPVRGEQPVVWSLLADHRGTLWAGTQHGLFFLLAGETAFREFPLREAGAPISPVAVSLTEDAAGNLWAGSSNALFQIDPARKTSFAYVASAHDAHSLMPGEQWAVTEMRRGFVWSGTDAAISIVDVATHHVRRVIADTAKPTGLNGGRIQAFLHDRSGLVWIANHVGGVLLYNPLARGLYQLASTQPEIGFGNEGIVSLAALPDGALWVAGAVGHLAELQPRGSTFRRIAVPNRPTFEALFADRNQSLWLGSTAGLCRMQAADDVRCPPPSRRSGAGDIYALLDDGGRMLVGGSGGLSVADASGALQPYRVRGRPVTLSNTQVRVLFRDRRDRLWVGTENGLNRIDRDGTIARFVYQPHDPDSIGPGGMTSIMEDRRGRIWAGSNGGPLEILTEDASGKTRFKRIGRADGMPHENVDGLAEDRQGRVWASTDKGIAVIDPVTLKARALGIADGVSDGAFWAGSVSQARDGTIFFGGLDGATIVTPGAHSDWTYEPPIVASMLHVGRKATPAQSINRGDGRLTVPPDARDISVEFSALDYSASATLRYQYRLAGYESDWVDADSLHRVATYTHLPPGNYTLEIRGTNRLGVWSSHVLSVAIRALPAWYETWWFRALVVLAVLLLAYGAHRRRTAVLRRRQRELEMTVNDRTHELSEVNAKLEEASLTDPLTGLRNRRFLDQHMEADIALTLRRYEDWRAGNISEPPDEADLLFFLIDLDHLKMINDRYGHPAGDNVLIQMRERLYEVFREADFIVRWGGDEFLAVARGTRRSEAGGIAERICDIVTALPFQVGGGHEISGSVSVGFAAFPFVPDAPAAITWAQVVTLADHALYMGKEGGRNAWFGLAATSRTDPELLVTRLERSAAEAVRAGNLEVITHVMSRGDVER
jgi:diguanylate cyclase (GGDEF)-like protein